MKSVYRITPPEGKTVDIIAKTRGDAIREYCLWSGCTREFVTKHCTVKRLGVA